MGASSVICFHTDLSRDVYGLANLIIERGYITNDLLCLLVHDHLRAWDTTTEEEAWLGQGETAHHLVVLEQEFWIVKQFVGMHLILPGGLVWR